ncbi:glycosyltransferase [Sandarakinorhabdus sp. DWP1-3-1]|uniref:glycosyltransferase n=1 Tax=Sandarakinorhabdus sp. DWP1-3-1 TaxID=2804627 RepID=UPI003CE945DA
MRAIVMPFDQSIGESAATRPLLIVLSHLRWDFVFQRPQHVLTRATRHCDVIYIEEPLYEGTEFSHRTLIRENGVRVVQPLVPPGTPEADVIFHQGDVLESFADAAIGRTLLLWYYTPMAYAFGHRIDADVVIFDKMDELSAFKFASPQLHVLESLLMDRADVVFTGGASLQKAATGRHDNLHCFPSSIDVAHFGAARDAALLSEPEDMVAIPHPRIGFFGVLDERINLELVADMAAARPDWHLVMIGPTAKIDPASLPQAPNIHWLGSKQYAELPRYMAHWDIGFMPFALNDATRFISPTKTPEFLAAGLPLLSTPIHDVVEPYGTRGFVEVAATADGMVLAGDRLLATRADAAAEKRRLTKVDSFLSGNSWDKTWAAMYAEIRRFDAPTVAKSSMAAGRELAEASRV